MTAQLANSALAALQKGSFAEAEAICADALRRNPHDSKALLVLGNARAYSGDTVGAETFLERARAVSPHNVVILNSLGGVYGSNGKLRAARAVLEEAVAIDDRFPWAHQNLGNVLAELGERSAAKRHYETALRTKPDYPEAIAGLADIAEREHRLDEAEQLAQRALALSPHIAAAVFVLGRIAARRGDHDGVLVRMTGLTKNVALKPRNQSLALTLIGQSLERLHRYDEAFAAFESANEIGRKIHAAQFADDQGPMSLQTIARLTAFVETAELASWRAAPVDNRPDPVFFVGFPRSGTTLFDQVLASHPHIETAEEDEALQAALDPLLMAEGGLASWATMSASDVAALRSGYWRRSQELRNSALKRPLFVDKMPLYSAVLPVIHLLFPRARILFAVRDPRDVVISCFQQNFEMNAAMFHFLSLDSTVRYYDAVMRLADVSRERLPLALHVVRYEDVVGDFDRTVGAALAFLGVPWDSAVRGFAETAKGRVLKTPSALQVTQPLYSTSVGRWRHYETQLRPHLSVLNRWARRFEYPP